MEKNEIVESDVELSLLPSRVLTVAAAVKGNGKSKYVVRWALDKFALEENLTLKLLHVCPRVMYVPTPMGNYIHISQVRDDVAAAYKKEVEWQKHEMLLPYRKMCALRKIQADIVIIESDDVSNAIAEEVTKRGITKLVIGAPSRGMFSRSVKKNNLSSRISVCTPSSCTVYAVSKGKLSSIRPSDVETNGSIRDDSSVTSSSSRSSSDFTSSIRTDSGSVASYSSSSQMTQRYFHAKKGALDVVNHSRRHSLDIGAGNNVAGSCSSISEVKESASQSFSFKSFETDKQSWISDRASTSDVSADWSLSKDQVEINSELEKLRIQLRHVKGLYAVAQSENIDASRKVETLDKRRLEESMKLQEISSKEEKAKGLARQEKEKSEAAMKEAEYTKNCASKEASQRQRAELNAIREAKEKERLENAIVDPVLQYQKFSWEEIVSATLSFSDDLKIGMGAYGTVYKGSLHHTTAAIKVLHSKDCHNIKEFKQELEILSRIRHPHLLLLIGACVDQSCLVYEYMENGSLEERLLRKNNGPPIPWFERYRIAWEIASALVFLHSSKPKPIIHRDLKPANILLDHNFVSKIGDVGLSTMINSDTAGSTSTSTLCKDTTGPVGTLCYLDPEYQRTGVVSPKCDVYAFGIVILQLLTAKPAMALFHAVETAVNDGKLGEILDSDAGNWPIDETKELALLALRCSELQRKDRPDLRDEVLPVLERLKEFAHIAASMVPKIPSLPPNHFICPILKDVMDDPCVAADGYTYERKAIERWLDKHDNSPMTNLRLPSMNLLPNYNLLCAIMEWKSRKQ